MKNLIILCCLFALPLLRGEVSTRELAVQAVKDFNAGNFEAVRLRGSERIRKELTPELMASARDGITGLFGDFLRIATVRETVSNGNVRAFALAADFQRGRLVFNLAFDRDDQLISFLVSPPRTLPQPVNNEFFSEKEISLGGDKPLPGFLTVPNVPEPYPAVILVHGSGPQDRDETVINNTVFRDLAHGLARQGVGVLRYDKRTYAYPENVSNVDEEVINDVLKAVEFLKERGCRDIHILGHSLGAMLIPRIAAHTDSVRGYIMMAPAARPLEDILVEQVTYLLSLDQKLPEAQRLERIAAIKREAARIKVLTRADPPDQFILDVPVSYWLDLQDYSPVDSAREMTVPVLVLQGERDYQVTMVDFCMFRDTLSVKKNFRFKSYPELNHLFIGGSGPGTPQEYGVKGSVSEEVIRDIGNFIKQSSNGGAEEAEP